MAISEIVKGAKQQTAARRFILDSIGDLGSIPTDKAGPGSVAIVPSAGMIFFLTPNGEWTPFEREG